VVVLVDIDQLRRSQQHLVDARDFASSVVESVPVPIVVLNQDCTVRTVNTSFRHLTQMQSKELEGRSLPDLVRHLWGVEGIGERLEVLLQPTPGAMIEFEHESTTSQKKTLLIKAQALSTDGSRVLLLMMEDITLRREAELLITKQKAALEGEIEVAARRLNRTQEELRGLTAHLFSAQEEERQRVARELHDDVSQRLSILEMWLREMQDGRDKDDQFARLASALEHVQTLNTDVRQISHRLHRQFSMTLGFQLR
jgi:two-component system CheB/CheR fusion protein